MKSSSILLRGLTVLFVGVSMGGCGLVFQGRTQTVIVQTDPPGANGTFAGTHFETSPVEITVRRLRDGAVLRASKQGYHPDCKVVPLNRSGFLVFLDSVPLPLGLLVDRIAGTWPGQYASPVSVSLKRLEAGEQPQTLPSDIEILQADERHTNLCGPPLPLAPEEIWTAWFAMKLASVDRPAEAGRRYGAVERIGKIVRDDREFPKFVYRDANIALIVVPVKEGIEFELENLTTHAEKIVWDEVAFVDFDQTSHRVMHSGVRYIDRSASQPPSVVAPKKLLRDTILPLNRVVDSGKADFVHRPLFSTLVRKCSGETAPSFQERAAKLKGAAFGILLPVEIAGVVNEYTLNFEIETVEFQKERGCPTPTSIGAYETIQRGQW